MQRQSCSISGVAGSMLGTITVMPVSYTHLDVYKRQEHAVGPMKGGYMK